MSLNWDLLSDSKVLEECRRALREDGVMVLRNAASSQAVERLKQELLEAPYNETEKIYTCWQDPGDTNYGPEHPRNYKITASSGFVSRKTLESSMPSGTECKKQKAVPTLSFSLFQEAALLDFVRAVSEKPLHRSEDPNGSVYAYRIHPNHTPPWHFDESPYTAILYLQQAEEGGALEYVPWVRSTHSKDDERGHAIVRQVVMEKDTTPVKQVLAQPGSLVLFCGAKTFHRAEPIGGSTIRLGLVFTFGESPGFANSDDVTNANKWDPDMQTNRER